MITFINENQLAFLQFTTVITYASGSRSVPIDPYCNSWIVQNLGDIWVTVNGVIVKGYPPGHPELTGASYGASGNYGEIYRGNINIQSAQTTSGSGTTEFNCVVIQKCYIVS